jgi:ABC-2 type transport system ATP-binding protein
VSTLINASGLRRTYGSSVALDNVSFQIQEGRIVGLIGPNGAGKTTALKAMLGLTNFDGQLSVLGLNPITQRHELMQQVCFIADVAVLPPWLRVGDAVDFMQGVHPRFDRARAEEFLARTTIKSTSKVRELSKGMVTQLHLALVMAVDARLLILDEPTLGLDLLFRKQFYDTLLNDYFDRHRTIVVTTHQVEEIQHVLTDLIFIDRGKIVLDSSMEQVEERFIELQVAPDKAEAARALGPIHERALLGRIAFTYEDVPSQQLAALGEIRTPSVADLFVATITGSRSTH